MNNLCLLTNLTSADIAAWAQAVVGSIAIVVGAYFVVWQVRRGRLQECEREANELLGLARLLVHLREGAVEARIEKRKLERWPHGHPSEPATRFLELAEAILRVPLENVHGDAAFEALLNARRVAKEIQPLVGPEPELDINPNFQSTYEAYIKIIDQQIEVLRKEAQALLQGKRTIYSVENMADVGSKNATR